MPIEAKPGKTQFNISYFLMTLLIVMSVVWYMENRETEVIPYSTFMEKLEAGEVVEVLIQNNSIAGKFTDESGAEKPMFVTNRVESDLVEELEKHNIKYSRRVQNDWLSRLLFALFPAVLLIGGWFYIMRYMASKGGASGMMSIGKSKAKIFVETDIKVSFHDVAGGDTVQLPDTDEEPHESLNLRSRCRRRRRGGRRPLRPEKGHRGGCHGVGAVLPDEGFEKELIGLHVVRRQALLHLRQEEA